MLVHIKGGVGSCTGGTISNPKEGVAVIISACGAFLEMFKDDAKPLLLDAIKEFLNAIDPNSLSTQDKDQYRDTIKKHLKGLS